MNRPPDREVDVFSAARRLSASERAAYLDEACAGNVALRQRVERLLGVIEEAEGFLQVPAPGAQRPAGVLSAPTLLLNAVPSEKPGDRIGRYKLLQQIGEGGCGVVYMAEQEEPVRRRVALKVIKLGMDTKQVIGRFEAERQALALMDHPYIAKVLDAGATATGRPYFVMELVRGIKITDYCDENNLSTQERLKLFIQVCQAIQHAHQKGVIHRDIKPSNILVTVSEPGAPGCPKVIDFGIAKATTGQRLTDQTVFTAFEQFIGTPAYMSPEQAMMTALEVDTRTDIYGLGVLLYELLTGKTPLDQKELLAAGLEEMRRTICEKEAARPSTRLSTMLEGELTTTAKHRHTDAPKLIHLLRGDLDWIVMKALEKERARRYETANGLANDVQRYLADEPVFARPPSKLYRLQKSFRRNKLAYAAAGAVAAALLIGFGVSTVLLVKERATRLRTVTAEKKAMAEAVKSRQFANLLKSSFKSVGPSVAKGRDTQLVREILDETISNLGNEAINLPEVEVELCLMLAATYFDLGEYKPMLDLARRGLQVARSRLGEENEYVADSLITLGLALLKVRQEQLGSLAHRNPGETEIQRRLHDGTLLEAEQCCLKGLAMYAKLLGNENLKVAHALGILASVRRTQANPAKAEALDRESLALFQKLLGDEDIRVAKAMAQLALDIMFQDDSRLADAESWIRKAISMQRKLLGDNHPDIANSLFTLASVQALERKWTEAVATYHEELTMWKNLQATNSFEVAVLLGNMASMLRDQGKLSEAEAEQRAAIELFSKLFGNEHKDVAASLARLAIILERQGKPDETVATYQQSLDVWRKLPNGDSNDHIEALRNLAGWLMYQGKHAEAEARSREALEIGTRLFGKDNGYLFANVELLARSLLAQGKFEDAEGVYRDALATSRRVQGDGHNNAVIFSGDLGETLQKQGKLPEAEQAFRQALEILRRHSGDKDGWAAHLLAELAIVLHQEGKLKEVDDLINDGLARQPSPLVADALLTCASDAKRENLTNAADAARFLLHRAAKILQELPSQDLAGLQEWTVESLVGAGYQQVATNLCWRMLDSSATNAVWFNNAAWFLATAENPSNREPALAVELAKHAMRLNPKRNDWNTLGVARYRTGDFRQALADLDKSAELDRDLTSFNSFFMAMAHHQLGDGDAARRLYDQGIKWINEHAPQNPELLRFRAEAEQMLGAQVQPQGQALSPIPPTAKAAK